MRRLIQIFLIALATLTAAIGVLLAVQLAHSPTPAPPRVTPAVAELRSPTPTGALPRPIGRPTRVIVDAIGVDEPLHGVGLEPSGAMTMPAFGDAAWYDVGPRPGSAGPAVIVAHVRGPAGPDVFWDLIQLEPGDEIVVVGTRGRVTFIVEGLETIDKDRLPVDRIWPETAQPLLRLITCGGTPDPNGGGFPANTIVYASLQ